MGFQRMRTISASLSFAAAVLLVLAAPVTEAAAQNYVYGTRYCSRAYDGATDCAYYTLRQCLMAVSATGGDCAVNPRYAGDPAPRYRRAPRVIR